MSRGDDAPVGRDARILALRLRSAADVREACGVETLRAAAAEQHAEHGRIGRPAVDLQIVLSRRQGNRCEPLAKFAGRDLQQHHAVDRQFQFAGGKDLELIDILFRRQK